MLSDGTRLKSFPNMNREARRKLFVLIGFLARSRYILEKLFSREPSGNIVLGQKFRFQMKWLEVIRSYRTRGWSGGAMVLGKLPVLGRPTIWIRVGQGPTALSVGAGGGCLDIFTLIYSFSPLSPILWETVRYRLKYCPKGPLNPKQPTNLPDKIVDSRFCDCEDECLRNRWR